jgi:hypothetical protein
MPSLFTTDADYETYFVSDPSRLFASEDLRN